MCQPTVALAVAAVEAMQAIWAKPFDPGVYPKMTASQTIVQFEFKRMAYAEQAKQRLWCTEGSLRSFQKCAHSRIALALLAPLIAVAGFWTTLDQTSA